ncbi:MAG: hypothetical protein LBO08_02810 [Rickettsiales bacterium]|jgi:signal recognition particle subunit SRP54|nr:hypothetical protein [Rickettsiales bacterium]
MAFLGFGKKKELENAAGMPAAEEKIPSGMKETAARMMSGQFDMNDMLAQLKQMKKMSHVSGLLKLMPGAKDAVNALKEKIADGSVDRQIKILEALTAEERRDPSGIFLNRKNEIAEKSGASVRELEHLIKKYEETKRQMKMIQQMGGMEAMMEKMRAGVPGGANSPMPTKGN